MLAQTGSEPEHNRRQAEEGSASRIACELQVERRSLSRRTERRLGGFYSLSD
ncbi:hypothetical protein ACF08E_10570 [Streptomyces globisporus]|uniref:hypothetical protein n=1 Tax=Streptomyces globisporus TaxID=1908 RepID=UPI0036F7BCB8